MSGTPIHFDLAQVEAVSRKTLADAIARARKACGDAPSRRRDRHLIDVQERLYEVNVAASVALADLRNSGASTTAINIALGGAIGSIAASWLGQLGGEPEATVELFDAFCRTVSDLLAGLDDDARATRSRTVIRGVEGGTA